MGNIGRNGGWGTKIAIGVAVLLVVILPQFIELHSLIKGRPQGPVSSSEHAMFAGCLAAVGSPGAGKRSTAAAYCNCYTAAAIFQQRPEIPDPGVAQEDFALLLTAVAGERPGETLPQDPLPRSLPPAVEGFVSAVLPECRGRAIAWSERLRREVTAGGAEGVPEPRSASNRPAGRPHDFHLACMEAQGASPGSATLAQKALCQCYYIEARRWNIVPEDLPSLLETVDGHPAAGSGDSRRFDAFLKDSLPRCRKRSAAIAETEAGR